MADCSKTEVFLAEWKRMCESHPRCNECSLFEKICHCSDVDIMYVLTLKDYIQKWSDEHPAPKPKTYVEAMIEMLQKFNVSKMPCRNDVFDLATDCFGKSCDECWNEPYKEGE